MRLSSHSDGWNRHHNHESGRGSQSTGSRSARHAPDPQGYGYTYEADYTRITSDTASLDKAEHAHTAQAVPTGRIPGWAISAIYHYGQLGSEPPVGTRVDVFV